MNMEVIRSERRLCVCCMTEHDVKIVRVKDHTIFKEVLVEFDGIYEYCDEEEVLYMDEDMITANDIAIKDAYRKNVGLLTSKEISMIRKKYGISQSDLCLLLGWGGKTITRYEGHQVQDKAHDTILKKLDKDPEWFLYLLMETKNALSSEVYKKYFEMATILYEKNQDSYLRKAIEAKYARYQGNQMANGNAVLSLDKVVDVIRYFASAAKVTNLYKVKLMKLMWYSDALSYKRNGHAITGLVYQALPMGAVPIGHDSIIELKNIPCEEVDIGDGTAYYFSLREATDYPTITDADREILDTVIEKLGKMTKDEIVDFMHKEQAYVKTAPRDIISFQYAESLQI